MTTDREAPQCCGQDLDSDGRCVHRPWHQQGGIAVTGYYQAAFERAMAAAYPDWDNPSAFWSPERDAALTLQIKKLTAEVVDLRAECSEAVVEGLRGIREAQQAHLDALHCSCRWCSGETESDGACGCAFCEHRRWNDEDER